MNIRLFFLIQKMLKYSVVVGCVLLTIHVGLLIIGYDMKFAEWMFGLSVLGFITMLMASYCLRFCWLFRAFLIYDFVVAQCIEVQRCFHPFGDFLQLARLIVFAAGVFLLSYLLSHIKEYGRTESKGIGRCY